MHTMSRLLNAYEKGYRMPFNNQAKIIFFSDVHRGDNSISDEFAHNQTVYYHALEHYYESGYTYIEVGDGDELWEHSKFKYVRSAHNDVYELIRKFYRDGRFEMIFGNHNMSLKNSKYVSENLYEFYCEYQDESSDLFPDIKVHEAIILEHEETGKEVFVVHGHQGDFINDQMWRLMKTINRHFWHYLHIVGFRNPSSPAKNRHKRHKIEKNYTKWIKKYKKMLIVGHTHRPKFPSENEEPYFNTGSCLFPRSITGLELNQGEISLVDWRIKPDAEGVLHISKNYLKGPRPIEEFML
ncbi:MAG: serine/threonine protein phosphatase [Clostridia bacterium]|nr:serine/threonine protein phosphatase [Clostridia bacterium]